jgi:hypothetical protein
VPALDANNPLAARADLLGERRLAEAEPLAAISNDRAKIGGSADKHTNTLSTFDDIITCDDKHKCQLSATYYCEVKLCSADCRCQTMIST